MKRCMLLLSAIMVMVGVAALAPPAKPGKLVVLEWAAKAKAETPPVAVLLEFGGSDKEPTAYSGSVAVKGAKVVHREGYRFRKTDRLTDAGWTMSSHRAIRVPPRSPQVSKVEKIATVGVVLHLADIQAEATLNIAPADKTLPAAEVPLKDVVAGKAQKIFNGSAVVRLVTTATAVTSGKTENDFPAACHGPDGTLWLAYIAYTLKDESRRNESANLKEQPKDFKDFYKPEFGDQLFVKYYRDGKWSEPVPVTGAKEDLNRCRIAANVKNQVIIQYGAQRNGEVAVHSRIITDGAAKSLKLESEGNIQPDIASPMITGGSDSSYLQGWSDGRKHYRWNVVEAHGPGEQEAYAVDSHDKGDYDILVMVNLSEETRIASSKFEARPSLAYDPAGRLWIAYEEGPVNWGKDSGALAVDKGNPLYNERSVRVVCLQDGKLFRPAAELPTSNFKNPGAQFDATVVHRFETAKRYSSPKIGIDGKGRVWLTYRESSSSRYSSIAGSYWLTYARRLVGDHWSEPIEVHHSDGMMEPRPVLLPHASGGLTIFHNSDGRYTLPEEIHNQVYMSYIDLPGEPAEPKLVPHEIEKKDPKLVKAAEAEREAVARMRGYRLKAQGKELRLLRGELHRHTETSWDGGADGSLEDMFRYAIDAADLDWIANADHDNGAGREYSWWLTQKLTDAFHVKDRFTPLFGYERSVSYPHGHRNCLFTRRGVMTLPRLAETDPDKRVAGIHADDTKMFYRYLHELNGLCASHTSATGMGTDWRDNDPKVEPIVEIYQGDRNSYEYEEAPRAGHDPKSGKQPVALGGWRPAGFLDHAFKKGYRLGFQSSSDHWSTHISFCVVLAERHDREAIFEALQKRRCYAATDNIIADVKSGDHLMGEEFKTSAAPTLKMAFVGTGPIAAVHIVRDSKVVHTIKVGKSEYRGDWTDPNPEAGVHYYYVRVEQENGELAWTSPMWIDFGK